MTFVALIVHDTPYGVKAGKWDIAHSTEELRILLQNIAIVNTAKSHVYVAYVAASHFSTYENLFREYGYQDIIPFYWYKTDRNIKGFDQYTFAVEQLIVAYKGGKRSVPWFTPENPMHRHNLISGPGVSNRTLDQQGGVLNITEKPPYVSALLARAHCPPGANVLVLGCGVGGDVSGLVASGFNVVAVDSDPLQIAACESRMRALAVLLSSKNGQKEMKDLLSLGQLGLPEPKATSVVEDKPSQSPAKATPERSKEPPAKPGAFCTVCGEAAANSNLKCSKCSALLCQKCADQKKPPSCGC